MIKLKRNKDVNHGKKGEEKYHICILQIHIDSGDEILTFHFLVVSEKDQKKKKGEELIVFSQGNIRKNGRKIEKISYNYLRYGEREMKENRREKSTKGGEEDYQSLCILEPIVHQLCQKKKNLDPN
mgnify:CR=1 FL=1